MQKKKLVVLLTAAGLLGTTAAVGAADLTQKVSGLLRHDIKVSINGTTYSSLDPVYIDGKAYLPLRDAANALGYELKWSQQNKQFDLQSPSQGQGPGQGEAEEKLLQLAGVVLSVSTEGDLVSLQVQGKSANGGVDYMVLKADKDTVVVDEQGEAKLAKDIKPGTHVSAEYGPIVALSFPGQSHAAKIVVGPERLIKEDAVSAIEKTDAGWKVQLGSAEGDAAASSVILNVDSNTLVVTPSAEPVKLEDVKKGTKIRAYYGPITTKSIPAQSAAELLVVLPEETQQP
ncbi:stalk domain-containing protein [Cohnella sp. REN36]|uniref:stalk domain-containing protein n=1 Tax=Cohnella sp. REN36 TaxID=2887347 RepID=UPI001D15E367|nr:stalk domain-containing protein [Cohnella sp. REN36]MCC3377203.1 copper amine oxidase N-terminal domain-containing protein [Cohnella sp. REN36]